MKLCFISPDLYPYISSKINDAKGEIKTGGAEKSLFFQMEYFQKDNVEVHVIVSPVDDNVTDWDKRFFIHSIERTKSRQNPYKLFKLLKQIKPTHVVMRGVTGGVFDVSLLCRILKIKFIYEIASTPDSDLTYFKGVKGVSWKTALFFYLGMFFSSSIIAQTTEQKRHLRRYFPLPKKSLIRNSYNFSDSPIHINLSLRQQNILWIGNFHPNKDPESYVKLAEACKDKRFHFYIAGDVTKHPTPKIIIDRINGLANMTYLGQLHPAKIQQLLKSTFFLVQTSYVEGMSNVLIEAWANKVPTLVLRYDADNIIQRFSTGKLSGSVDSLLEHLLYFSDKNSEYMNMAENAFSCAKKLFYADENMGQLKRHLLGLK